jgi:hypothetical protein
MHRLFKPSKRPAATLPQGAPLTAKPQVNYVPAVVQAGPAQPTVETQKKHEDQTNDDWPAEEAFGMFELWPLNAESKEKSSFESVCKLVA